MGWGDCGMETDQKDWGWVVVLWHGKTMLSRGATMVVIPAQKWPLGSGWSLLESGRSVVCGLEQHCCQEVR